MTIPRPAQPQPQPQPQPTVAPSPTTDAKTGRIGFRLAVATLVLATIVPALAWFFIMSGGINDVGGDHPSAYGMVALVAIVVLLVVTVLPWLTAIPATVLGIISLTRGERPRWWAIVAIMSIPITVVCWLVTSAFSGLG